MNDRLQAIKARLEAITSGEWVFRHDAVTAYTKEHGSHLVSVLNENGTCWRGDAAFIAAAPDDIRYLLGEVERLRELVDRTKHYTHDRFTDDMIDAYTKATE